MHLEEARTGQDPVQWLEAALEVSRTSLSTGASEEGLRFAHTIVNHAREQNSNVHLISALNNLGTFLFLNSDPYDSLNVVLEAKFLIDTHQIFQEKGRNLNLLGGIYQLLSSLDLAYASYEESLSIARANNDQISEARTLNNMALLLQQQKKYSESLSLYQQAEGIWRSTQNDLELCKTLLNKISLHLQKDDEYTASLSTEIEQSMLEVRQILKDHDAKHLYIALLQSEAHHEKNLGHLEKAEKISEEALYLATDYHHVELEAHTYLILGNIYHKKNKDETALDYFTKARNIFADLNYKDNRLDVLTLMVVSLKRLGRFEEALQYHEEMYQLDREIRNEATSKQLEMLAFQRKLEQSQHEAELEKIRNEELESLVQERTAELESAYLEMLERLAIAAEFRDTDTGEHTVRVGERAAEVARELNMPEERVRTLRLAARLHDVGKIAISDTILHKPGKLTEDEYLTMKAHTLAGAKMLSEARSELIRMAEMIALTHHEKWDGTGYPNGLSGEDIPLEGRIVAVVDVLDALTSLRPYKKAWSMDEALAEIEKQAGVHFDPQVVQALMNIYRR
ncbi:HD domain-containing phosphohydrolase [Deinococcus roseus]|nr:HD domain-containing phosphohydrolase [Deinococcus roseus]